MATFYLNPAAGSNGDGSIGSPFNTFENCLSAILTPFNSATEDYIVNCLTGVDASSDNVLIAVTTASATARVLRFIASGADKHTGVRGTGYRFTAHEVRCNNDNTNVTVELDGLSIASIGQDRAANVTVIIRNCLIADSAGNGAYCGGGTMRLINTAIIGSTFENVVAENNNGTAIVELINCTAVDSAAGDAGVLARFGGSGTAINTYSGGNAATADFSGLSSLTNCRSEDGSQSTTTAAFTTSNFTVVTAGSENLKLPSGSALIDVGVGPGSNGSVPTTDFEGDARSGATTDVGFDQFTSGASTVTKTPATGNLSLAGRAVLTNAFSAVRIREVLINESGQPIVSATNIHLAVWYGGACRGAPDVSLNAQTTDANGTTSWSISTGTLNNGTAIFYVAQDSLSFSNYTAARMIPSYE